MYYPPNQGSGALGSFSKERVRQRRGGTSRRRPHRLRDHAGNPPGQLPNGAERRLGNSRAGTRRSSPGSAIAREAAHPQERSGTECEWPAARLIFTECFRGTPRVQDIQLRTQGAIAVGLTDWNRLTSLLTDMAVPSFLLLYLAGGHHGTIYFVLGAPVFAARLARFRGSAVRIGAVH